MTQIPAHFTHWGTYLQAHLDAQQCAFHPSFTAWQEALAKAAAATAMAVAAMLAAINGSFCETNSCTSMSCKSCFGLHVLRCWPEAAMLLPLHC
ncbi:MAG: hypothetical protein KBH24_01715 [Brachymonas sp.]|nr:hypothetical protein [Brachymonas sp.]